MKSALIDYFPAKLAKAPRFCNRLKEREMLTNSINLGRHTVLVSPRRYGKSSLVHQVVHDMKVPCASIDLFLAHDGKAITKRILDGISSVIADIIPLSQKALSVVQTFFNHFKVVMEVGGFSLQFSQEAFGFDPVDQIFASLKSLAKLAESRKKKVLIFLDEFQDIASAENAKSIQGAIRHVAQDTSNVVFVFSGSNRHLLLELFDDKNMPLYMLCDKMPLERMSSEDYGPYIQEAAVSQWRRPLDSIVLNRILTLTELHPFYVNFLCNALWKGKLPTAKGINANLKTMGGKIRCGSGATLSQLPVVDDVTRGWIACYEIEERRLIAELESLTPNQQGILKALSRTPISEPNSQKFLNEAGLPLSSVRVGIKALLAKDMVYRVKKDDMNIPALKKGQYRVLDPLLAYALRKYS